MKDLQGVYVPNYSEKETLTHRTETNPKLVLTSTSVPKNLEQEKVNSIISSTSSKIDRSLEKINQTIGSIDSLVQKYAQANQKDYGFVLDLKNKPTLRRAVNRIFGNDTNEITYSMYKELLSSRSVLEMNEISELLN